MKRIESSRATCKHSKKCVKGWSHSFSCQLKTNLESPGMREPLLKNCPKSDWLVTMSVRHFLNY